MCSTRPGGRVHALRDVSFDVPRGKIVGVVGESGSGKSTVIWAMTQLLASNGVVEGGQIMFDGRDVLKFSKQDLQAFRGEQASIVFQDPMTSQIPVKSYGQQMADIAYRRRDMSGKQKIAAAVDMMRRVGIPDAESRIDQYPHQFSGGMRQRAGIAMALLMNPLLLIGDEPTTALDVTMEAQIIHLLRELQQEFQATVLLVSHNLGLIAELCDEVVVMYAGEVIEKGDVRQIFYNAAHPYTRALLECDPARVLEQSRVLPTIPGDLPDLRDLPTGCIFAQRCQHAIDRCRTETPGDHKLAEGHVVRCHLPEGVDAATVQADPAPPRPLAAVAGQHPQPLLSVENLRVRFRTAGWLKARLSGIADPYVDAVMGVSLDLYPGETLGLVGESGSGKTTLGRAILGLLPAAEGTVRFEGQELNSRSRAALQDLRQHMSMMFQDPVGSLSPRLTVRALVTEPFVIHGRGTGDLDRQAEKLCAMVNLPANFLSRYPHELSGGQARRVGVARALALEPRMIIADEPTAGLDVSVQGEVLNLMRTLQVEHGLGYLVITHNLPVVRHICDRLAIMYLGRIVEQGPCDEVFAQPAHPYTESLVRGVPLPDPDKRRELISIEGEVPSLAHRPSGCEFHTRCRYVAARCRIEAPAERVLASGRRVMCHFPLTESPAASASLELETD
jgi:oligopeptide/dipeptide ABC transporter ATP-binding protein